MAVMAKCTTMPTQAPTKMIRVEAYQRLRTLFQVNGLDNGALGLNSGQHPVEFGKLSPQRASSQVTTTLHGTEYCRD
jgi:hypothetical protein